MLTINIIPEAYEKHFRIRKIYFTFRFLMLVVVIYLLLVASLLLLARFFLQREFARIIDETTLVTTENRRLERDIQALNSELQNINAIEKKHKKWANLMISLTQATPAGISLESLQLSDTESSSLSGNAITRNDLLKFKQNLENIEGIEKVQLPVTDLVTARDLDFKIKFTIKLKNTSL